MDEESDASFVREIDLTTGKRVLFLLRIDWNFSLYCSPAKRGGLVPDPTERAIVVGQEDERKGG
ncbi:hypothetical protein MKY41_03840 [Sporosarcina sp. FSL W7-1349]|uniref:hypothetical protein n=1 Tax=Sporosarcina sp. FSL W7-1349 TaxID=2921561 RepID=UPI0030F6AA75